MNNEDVIILRGEGGCNIPVLTPRMYSIVNANVVNMLCMISSMELKAKFPLVNTKACKGKYFICFMMKTMC